MERAVDAVIVKLRQEVITQTGEADAVRVNSGIFCDMVTDEFKKRADRPKESGRWLIFEILAYLKKLGFKVTSDHFRSFVDITPA